MNQNWIVHKYCLALLVCISFLFTSCKNAGGTKAIDNKNWPEHFGFGKPASAEKIAAVDIDVRPDGKGLPAGSGTIEQGENIYVNKCAGCHGINGTGGAYAHLVSSDTSKAKTIGNYWPYATTVFDYIRRAMPFNAPGSLTNEEVYSLTAFLLYKNKLISPGTVIDAHSLPKVEMPAKKLFVPDDRERVTEIR